MKFYVEIEIEVDPDSYFWTSTNSPCDDLEEWFRDMLYDLDDSEIIEINVKED